MSTLRADAIRVVLGGATVLDDASLDVAPGWTAVVGPNGAGKSTLLRALAGVVPLAAGSVTLDGRPIDAWPRRARASRIAWLAQLGDADGAGDLTARDAVQLGRLPATGLFGTPSADDAAVVDAAMRATACDAFAGRPLATLSGGERQRVLLARVLAVGARALLLDEPLAHLDPPHQVAMASLFRDLASAGGAVVTVLHDLACALAADRVAIVVGGRVAATGERDDPSLHAALADAFGGAIAISRVDGSWAVLPRWPRAR